ncbi:DUF6787 family protein [Aquimarina sp. 2304DJ70-9]|uniref:DUF6787 family protein n=1 Tax=Aquimarina penaris TaxID=3231044 RepID=UPI003462ADC3
MKKLMQRWELEKPFDLIIILFVFAITGSSSIAIVRPALKLMGLTLDNLNTFVYYPLSIILSFIGYQVFLVFYGWLFGQFKFFWSMEKKMLTRFGIKI